MTGTVPAIVEAHPVSARIVGFTDHLRMNGFKLGPAETQDALSHLSGSPLPTMPEIRQQLKILLTSRHDEWERFDDLFEAYWLAEGRRRSVTPSERAGDDHSAVSGRRLWREHLDDDPETAKTKLPGLETPGEKTADGNAPGRLVASDRPVRMKTDLRHFSDPQEITDAETLAYQLAKAMRYRLSRRFRQARNGSRLDLRRTIRANLSHGGDPLSLVRRGRPMRPVRVVVFLDVSGSMKAYSRFFLQFVKGLVCSWVEADAYLFHTNLIRVTDAVRDKDTIKAMTRLSLMADGFGGGTKLGASLSQFNDQHAKRALNSRSVAIILSDGYDTGTPDELARQLGRLKRRAPRLVWLNPLLGWRRYEPVTAAMNAALPFIDHFAAANTLEALAALEPELAKL